MKNFISLAVALMFINVFAAGAQQVWAQQKDKVIEYCNVVLTDAYLAGLKDSKSVADYNAIKDKLVVNSIDKPLSFEKLETLLKKGFGATYKKLSTPIHDIDLQSISETSGEAGAGQIITAIKEAIPALLVKIPDSDQKLDDIRKTVGNFLKKQIEEAESTDQDSPQAPPRKSGSADIVPNNGSGQAQPAWNEPWWVIAITVTPFLLFMILILFGINRYQNIVGRVDKRKQELVDLEKNLTQLTNKVNANASGGNSFNAMDELKKQVHLIMENSETIKRLHDDIKVVSEKMNQMGKSTDNVSLPKSNTAVSSINSPDLAKRGVGVFYMSYPVGNCFSLNARSESAENTIYRFLPRQNNSEASFEIHTTGGAPVSDIITSTEQFIKPACIEENLPGVNTRNIRTLKQGFAVLEGDRWVIKDKAHISYE